MSAVKMATTIKVNLQTTMFSKIYKLKKLQPCFKMEATVEFQNCYILVVSFILAVYLQQIKVTLLKKNKLDD